MDIRPCPRCRKVLPTDASFCRRCGVAMRHPPGQGTGPRAGAGGCSAKQEVRLGSRWASTVATTATAALGVVLALFAASGPRVAVRHGEPGPEPEIASADTLAAPAESRSPTRWAAPSQPAARKQSSPARRLADGSPIGAFALRNPPRPSGPEIVAVSSPSAGYDHKVTLRGNRLAGARQVLFIGTETGRAEARFVVWDDQHLIAAVPDLGPWRQDAAVAVLTGDGVALSVPADATIVDSGFATSPPGTVCIVRPGAAFGGGTAPVGFVENNAAARAAAGKTLFVRRGGRLWGHGGGDCLVFCERGVVVRSDAPACDFVEVDFVNPCIVPSLFHYTGH